MAGASLVGLPSITHGRTPIMAWGVTAINPDIEDIFVEYINEGTHYMTSEKKWEPLDIK